MASAVDAAENPFRTLAVLTASAKLIATRCLPENVEFLKCKKKDPNPDKCLEKGRDVTRCVLGLLQAEQKSIDMYPHVVEGSPPRCTKEVDAYVGCMYYTIQMNLIRVPRSNKHLRKHTP